jgi:hypothetical protein
VWPHRTFVHVGIVKTMIAMLKGIALSPIAGVDRSAQLIVIFGETSAGLDVGLSSPHLSLLSHVLEGGRYDIWQRRDRRGRRLEASRDERRGCAFVELAGQIEQ